MDFITVLPKSNRGNDSIWVIVDRLTKVAHFIPVKTTLDGRRLADLYISRIVSLHDVPKTIVSDRGSQFTSRSRRSYMKHWVPRSLSALPITPKPEAKPSM
jgi:transposase InsO family protein